MESRSHLQDSSSIARAALPRPSWKARGELQARASKAIPIARSLQVENVTPALSKADYDAPSEEVQPQSQSARVTAPMRLWEPFAVFLATFTLLAALVPRMTATLNPVTGDEPFYLMTAISILQDGDLNECNNYRQGDEAKLYPSFFAGTSNLLGTRPTNPAGWQGWPSVPFPLQPHPANLYPSTRECRSTDPSKPLPADGSQSELYSKHGLGMTLLVLPAFALWGRIGVVLFLVMLAALMAANIYLLAREATGKALPAVLTWVAFAVAAPFFAYSFLVFPEMAAGLLVLYAFRRIRLWDNNPWQVAGVGACMAFLPWLHYRFLPLTLALFIYFIYQDATRRAGRRVLGYGIVMGQLGLSAVLLMLFFYHRYGQIFPDGSDHAGINDVAGTLRGAAGLMLDEQWGLLVYAPIFVLTFVGLILMATKPGWRKTLLWLGVIVAPYYLLIANYAQWWGEWGPPARYLVSVLPLLALPFALSLEWIRNAAYKAIYGLLMVPSLVVTAVFAYQPQWMYSQPRPWCGSTLFTTGMTQLFPWLFGSPNPADLDCIRNPRTDYLGDGLVPTFVAPYFMYSGGSEHYGAQFSAAAWRASIGPIVLIALIVGVSLGLAVWQGRRDGHLLLASGDASSEAVGSPRAIEEVQGT